MFSASSIISLVAFLIVAFSCYRNGLFSSVVMLFVVLLSAASALMCIGPMPRMMGVDQLDWYAPPIVFLGIFILSFVILQTLANFLLPPKMNLSKSVDKLGGAAVGLVVAFFFTGVLMTGYDLFPGTGKAEDKVCFLNADECLVRTMAWMSARSGSVSLDADKFLRMAKQKKETWRLKERKDTDFDTENNTCYNVLRQLGQTLRRYTEANGGSWPTSLDNITAYLPSHTTAAEVEAMTECPLTKMRYVLFPVKNFKDIENDPLYVLAYDCVSGDAGHLGSDQGKRSVLFADWHAEWVDESKFQGLLKAQRESQKN